jgi:plastocyanin
MAKIRMRALLPAILLALLAACGTPDQTAAPAASADMTQMQATATSAPTLEPTSAPTLEPTSVPTAAPAQAADQPSSKPAAAMGSMEHATIKLFMFQPNPIEVAAGTTVMWQNEDAIEHSVTAGAPDAPSGAFDSGLFDQGRMFSWTFDAPGEYAYFCMRHPSMTGVVRVTP